MTIYGFLHIIVIFFSICFSSSSSFTVWHLCLKQGSSDRWKSWWDWGSSESWKGTDPKCSRILNIYFYFFMKLLWCWIEGVFWSRVISGCFSGQQKRIPYWLDIVCCPGWFSRLDISCEIFWPFVRKFILGGHSILKVLNYLTTHDWSIDKP